MKRIICEMCGSTELIKTEGVFECQSCGTKYSVEEAKKMMVEGTVKVDNSDYIKNFLEMAENAYDASNLKESEEYCNKIIENDAKAYKAWFIKGKAAGWQSTLRNTRFTESANCFGKAIEYAPDEEKEQIKIDGAEELKKLGLALIQMRGNHFEKYPDKEELKGFVEDRITILNGIAQYILKGGSIPKEYQDKIADIMNVSAVSAWNKKILPEFENDDSGHPSKYALTRLIEQADYCLSLIKMSIDADDGDDERDIIRYKNLIVIENYLINAWSYKMEFTAYGSYWTKDTCLTSEAKRIRTNNVNEYNRKMNQLQTKCNEKREKERKKRIEEYWKEHKADKEKLDNERKELSNKKKRIEEELSSLPENKKMYEIVQKINLKENEKKSLGLFKRKEKKALEEEVFNLKNEYNTIYYSVKDQIDSWNNQIQVCVNEINNIDNELNKDR